MKQRRRILLLANGDLPDPDYARSLLRPDDTVWAANGGTRHAWTLGRRPDQVMGDVDSLPASLKRWLEAENVEILPFSVDKEQTDLEIALRAALALKPAEILILGATGFRLDHTLANLSLLALAQPAGIPVQIVAGREHLHALYDRLAIDGVAGDTVSLLPWGGAAIGVSTEGLRWPLQDETLPFGPARGISNRLVAPRAVITLRAGLLIVAHHRGDVR